MKWILILIFITQIGCSFVVSAAGSFVGNLGSTLVEEKMREMEETAYCDPMGVRNCPKEKEKNNEIK